MNEAERTLRWTVAQVVYNESCFPCGTPHQHLHRGPHLLARMSQVQYTGLDPQTGERRFVSPQLKPLTLTALTTLNLIPPTCRVVLTATDSYAAAAGSVCAFSG